MKRDITLHIRELRGDMTDHYPSEVFNNRRSIRARSRDIKKEHKHARSIFKRQLKRDLLNLDDYNV